MLISVTRPPDGSFRSCLTKAKPVAGSRARNQVSPLGSILSFDSARASRCGASCQFGRNPNNFTAFSEVILRRSSWGTPAKIRSRNGPEVLGNGVVRQANGARLAIVFH
jgi:hypothetical protein